ncbi:hypothetical protein [Aneurinibacillus soli]|uniref:Lipoprotein n=1 Tax=Aneurinibacillus soli TaxID=1500254 RepID=A0A0U5B123_9BACL|nr:hypothetical protein [Aneurinibacillus soli]BAU27952.1 hypothetical protein CB4_02126 [Aneurinibacillus soli]
MKKNIITSSIALLLLGSLVAGCGEKAADSSKSTPQKEQLQNQVSTSTPESEKQAATEAVKQYLKAQGSIDYTDPSAYKTPEKYLTPSFAKAIQKMKGQSKKHLRKIK